MTAPNKRMKQTKPAQATELRSLSPVFGGPDRRCDILRTWKGTTFTMTD
jgi:hypothetical protein